MNFVSHLPWLAGLGLAALSFAALHHLASAPAISLGQEAVGRGALPGTGALLAAVFQYLVPGVLLLISAISFARRRRLRELPAVLEVDLAPDALAQMSRQEFDAVVAKAFRREGYLAVERAGGQSDCGVDLELFMGRDRYLVQCRLWQEPKVDVAAVRKLYRAIATERAVGGFIVTSGKFTDDARVLALGRSIRLVPADSLRTMLASASDMTISPGFSRRRDDPVPPACPTCGKAMMSRVAYQGPRVGQLFWGCTSFPACRGSREYK
jgi:restriction system protein